jgi:hypothetical protein
LALRKRLKNDFETLAAFGQRRAQFPLGAGDAPAAPSFRF